MIVAIILLLAGTIAYAADWSRIGADAGCSKYTSNSIPAGPFALKYTKRFYSKYAPNKGNFFYGSSVVTHAGKAMIIADDRATPPSTGKVTFLQFDWRTGQTESYHSTPWTLAQNSREVDSHHYTNPIIWHSDGRVYMRRGGDNGSTQVFCPGSGALYPIYNRGPQTIPQYDSTALMQTYKDMLICRFGHTYYTNEYYVASIAEPCFIAPNQSGQSDILGRFIMDAGPGVPGAAGPDGLYGTTGRYGDIPKCAADVCIMTSLGFSTLDPYPYNTKVILEATDLLTSQTLWTSVWTSDRGGQQGLGTSVSDYWRFLASETGHYVFFTRCPNEPVTVRVLDLRTGTQIWCKALTDPAERPLLAAGGGFLYIIGRSDQYKVNIHTGQEIWHTVNSWPCDQGYVLGNHDLGSTSPLSQDPLFRPMVLTDETLWFVNGDRSAGALLPTAATLVSVRTSDGHVARQIDLQEFYRDRPGENLLVVNDLLVADGLLGVLIGVRDGASLYPNSNRLHYQDLYVFEAVCPGDLNGDGHVNIADMQIFVSAWGRSAGAPDYDGKADLNGDDTIDARDLLILIAYWGK